MPKNGRKTLVDDDSGGKVRNYFSISMCQPKYYARMHIQFNDLIPESQFVDLTLTNEYKKKLELISFLFC